MKIQMNNILLLCVLVMLSLEIVGGAKCDGCTNVAFDNSCKKKPFVCTVGKWRSCFIRRTQKNGKIQKVIRGCISHCKTGVRRSSGHEIFTWCCSSDHCNSMNAWF